MKNLFNLTLLFMVVSLMVACKNNSGENAKVNDKAGAVKEGKGKSYTVDNSLSKIMWEGSKPTGTHNGTVNISKGEITVNGDNITAGNFTIDMNSITVLDLDGEYKDKLEAHLKGSAEEGKDDFFNVGQHPTASFAITKTTKLANDPSGSHLVYGNLTMKGITKEVGFKANVDVSNGTVKVTTPKFNVNRTDFGIKYGSPTFFEGLKDKAINDNMALQVNLVAK